MFTQISLNYFGIIVHTSHSLYVRDFNNIRRVDYLRKYRVLCMAGENN